MLRQFFSAVIHQLDMCECNGSKVNSNVTLSVFRSVSDGVVNATDVVYVSFHQLVNVSFFFNIISLATFPFPYTLIFSVSFMNLIISSLPELYFLHAKRFKFHEHIKLMTKCITQDLFPIRPVLRSSCIWSHLGKVFNFSQKKDHTNAKLQWEKKTSYSNE